MTEQELLRKTIDTLDNIRVPTALTQEIAVPIVRASTDLKALYNAIMDTVAKKEPDPKKPVEENEP